MKHRTRTRFATPVGSAGAFLLGLVLTSPAAHSQEPAYAESTVEATATITGVDPGTRMISFRTEDGEEFSVEAGPEVRNFEQIEPGDEVSVVYYQAVAAEVTDAPAGAIPTEPTIVGSSRAPLGEKPSGKVGMLYSAVVTVESVNTDSNTVKFTGPNGQVRELKVMRPEMQAFIADLEPGDRVQVTYGGSLAVAVTPRD
jgi:hypothetical protein